MPVPVATPPVSKIPAELLSQIFEILVFDHIEPLLLSSCSSPTDRLAWIVVTHVCKRWYQVARENARLWSDIEVARPLWAREMLRRSKGFPLTLTYTHVDNVRHLDMCVEQAFIAALAKSRSIKSIHITSPARQMVPFIDALSGSDVPMLESLSITGETSESLDMTERHAFLNGNAPRLTFASLVGCTIDPNTRLFRNVRTFCFSSGEAVGSASLPDMLTLLSNLPLIEDFTLGMTFPLLTPEQNVQLSSMRKLTLKHLIRLRLIGGAVRAGAAGPTDILQWLAFTTPPTIEIITTECDLEEGTMYLGATCARLFDPLVRHYPSEGYFTELRATRRYDADGRDVFYIVAYSGDHIPKCAIIFHLSFVEVWPESLGSVATEFSRRLPLESLRVLVLDSIAIHPLDFQDVFGCLPLLKQIATCVDDALVHTLRAVDSSGKYLFPSLAHLDLFYDGGLDEAEDVPQEELVEMLKDLRRLWGDLADILRTRAKRSLVLDITLDQKVPKELAEMIECIEQLSVGFEEL